jgi:hypothetical protein
VKSGKIRCYNNMKVSTDNAGRKSQDYNMEAKINIANKEYVNNRYGDLNSDGHKL